jgi:Protein of unknown function (DUF4232)
MTLIARNARNSLTGAFLTAASILAVGCGSHSSDATGQAPSPASAQNSSVAAASTPASAGGSQASSLAPASQTGVAPAGAPSCSTSDLRITLGNGGAGAGTDFTVLDFTNSGTAACTLYGFPGVSLTNSSGAQIGAAATRNPSKASTPITLAPGAKANATLGVGNAGNYPTGACKPTAVAQLKVFPPNQTQAMELPFAITGCAVSATHQLSVTAVTAGAGQTV